MGFSKPADISEAVVLYQTEWCGYCGLAKRLLKSRSIDFATIDVTGDPEARDWLREASGQQTVPQIFIGGESVGGYMELAKLDRSGRLAEMLSSVQPPVSPS